MILILFVTVLLISSFLIIVDVYFFLPVTDATNRQLLFGIAFQLWGIVATVLIVKKILDMRDTQRWEAINKYVFGFLYLKTQAVLSETFEVFGIEIELKESPTVKKVGVEYLNPEHSREWNQKSRKELEKIVKEGSQSIRKNIESWKPSTHGEFSRIMKSFKDEINELLRSYPHQIPPEFLSVIVDVRERTSGLSNQSRLLSHEDIMKEQRIDYKELNFSHAEMESNDVLDLFSKLLKLLDILEKNIGSEWKS
jgi:hypothetical protein